MEYPAKIHVRSELHYFPLIKDRLNQARRSLFRTTYFEPWLDISYVENDDGMIHYILQNQSYSDDESFDLPLIYHLNGHSLHFGRRQFCLVTGFKFGLISLREHRNGDIPFCNRLFPEKIGYDVKIIDVLAFIEDEEKFSKIWIIESSCESHRWWTRVLEIIPRALSWTRTPECLKWKYFVELFDKDMTLKGKCIEKEERFKKFSPKNKDLSHSISEDEPDNKDDISPKEDAGDVYCCDVNGDVSQCFIPANILVEKGDCERQQDDISKVEEDSEKKIQSKIQRLYKLRKARLNNIAKEDKQRKFIGHMNSSASMKLAIERCVPKKRKFVDVVRYPYTGLSITLNVPSMEELANKKNVLNPVMIEKCKSVKPWIEWLSRSDVGRCKFSWCNDISVDSSFWCGLCGLDDHRKGCLVDKVFIPINEPKCHWSLAMFHICSGVVTFYDNEITHDEEIRTWYADRVPKQFAVFGDCGVVLCMFLYRLAHGVPLVVDDPVQAALAYLKK
uniref:Phospholipase-like, aminotransferase-like mobile domain protein n=1 Tax=Tanacetum cinerariifolium TaxID=118510 RepID=A0A6L2JP06_TANCI|nr:phospholipase-like, aminotransferase-like mobile domain protein [Tanacetum cinerariifolium]